jgi:hypothetical protein
MMFFRSRCYNGGKQHHFEPRYSERQVPAPPMEPLNPFFTSDPAAIEAYKKAAVARVYIKDVCSWCGAES